MADDTLKPMTVEDIAAATGDTLRPSDPLKNGAGAAATGSGPNDTAGSDNADAAPGGGAKQVIADNVAKLRSETGDRARTLLEDGKGRATSALDQLSQMLQDAATQVDEKLGSQYGQYARDAADKVQGFSAGGCARAGAQEPRRGDRHRRCGRLRHRTAAVGRAGPARQGLRCAWRGSA